VPDRANTALEAANLALSEIGEPPIGSFQENSARGRAINRWYGIKRDEILRDHDWGFASAWIVPAMNPTPALGPLKHRFAMPADCLKVRAVLPYRPNIVNYGTGVVITNTALIAELESMMAPHSRGEWDLEAASVAGEAPIAPMVLVTNMQQPVVNFTRQIEIIRLWDAQAVAAFVKELASAIAPSIARDLSAGEKKHAEAADLTDEAARTDSREQSPRQVSRETSWVTSRYIGAGFRRDRRY
jgi:hypothetical protein